MALYARGGRIPGSSDPATYHWALIVGPKTERPDDVAIRYHAKDRTNASGLKEWRFERVEASLQATSMILVRITVAKIIKPEEVEMILRAIPIVQNNPDWDCITWVKDALTALDQSGCFGTRQSEWTVVKQAAIEYVTRKVTEHRFDGKIKVDTEKVPTYDLIDRKEVVP